MVASIGTEEDHIIHRGSTKSSISSILGSPVEQAQLAVPQLCWDFARSIRSTKLLVEPTYVRNDMGQVTLVPPPQLIHSRANFLFHGVLQGEHDVGESISLSLMTLGMWELLAPAMLVDKLEKRDYVLTVWFDSQESALAYKWALLKQ